MHLPRETLTRLRAVKHEKVELILSGDAAAAVAAAAGLNVRTPINSWYRRVFDLARITQHRH